MEKPKCERRGQLGEWLSTQCSAVSANLSTASQSPHVVHSLNKTSLLVIQTFIQERHSKPHSLGNLIGHSVNVTSAGVTNQTSTSSMFKRPKEMNTISNVQIGYSKIIFITYCSFVVWNSFNWKIQHSSQHRRQTLLQRHFFQF